MNTSAISIENDRREGLRQTRFARSVGTRLRTQLADTVDDNVPDEFLELLHSANNAKN